MTTVLKALREQGSPSAAARLVRREARARWAARTIERRIPGAARRGERVIVGPFLGEVGFELLYWIPMLRRLLADRQIDPGGVVAISRGSTRPWYADIAAEYVDVLELMDADDFSRRLADRRKVVGDQKQLTIEPLDRRLLAAARQRVGNGTVIHPALMFARLRPYWNGRDDLSLVDSRVRWRKVDPPDLQTEAAAEQIAFKPYFSACFPDVPANRQEVERLLHSFVDEAPTLCLPSPRGFGAGGPLALPEVDGVKHLEQICGRHDLEAQTALVAGSCLLVTTYGGFSYLGPLLGIPTIALCSEENFNPAHRAAIEEANAQLGPTPYVVASRGEIPLARSILTEALR